MKSVTVKAKWTLISYVKNFSYTGGQQTWNAPYAGYYKLEVWGAQGGSSSRAGASAAYGGYGAYAVGIISVAYNTPLYVYVGGAGKLSATEEYNAGGYNGGGTSGNNAYRSFITDDKMGVGSGGGATHIARRTGLLSSLSVYKGSLVNNAYYDSSVILIVGAGGGGANDTSQGMDPGSSGGGIIGNEATTTHGGCLSRGEHCNGYPGTQTSGGDIGDYASASENIGHLTSGSFGQGGGSSVFPGAGGGGGFFGAAGSHWYPGSGGSSYIGSSNLISGLGVTKHMTCYSCTTSAAVATRTNSNTTTPTSTPTADVARIGNGYAKITWMGDTL